MINFTSNTYTLKRKILNFANKISKPEKKFTADITYGILASGSCLLTDVADQLHEPSKKINIVDRLSKHLQKMFIKRLSCNGGLCSYCKQPTMATELRNRRKGKVKTSVFYKGKDHDAYLSHVKIQITASRKDIYLVLVYGITEHPMMLATHLPPLRLK